MFRSTRPYAVSAPARGTLISFIFLIALLLTIGFGLTRPSPVDADTFQDGPRNFAGPAELCPGEGWECTEITELSGAVHQNGSENVIVCVGDTSLCANSTQDGDSNKIECSSEEVGTTAPSTQVCGPFEQFGGKNEATFKLTHVNTTGFTQCATQAGEISQFGDENYFKANFRIEQRTTSGAEQIQDARQSLDLEQSAIHKNQSDVEQIQLQVATGNATVQMQNAGCEPPHVLPSCADDVFGLTTPNTCADVDQEIVPEGDSENISKLKQEVKQQATTRNTAATLQQQGQQTGGNLGVIHQEVFDDDGKSTDVVDQHTQQQLSAPRQAINAGLDQEQYEDPVCCGLRSQHGGVDSEEIINQTVQQQAGRDATQEASAKGVAISPEGDCTISQNIQINGASESQSESLEPCPVLTVVTACGSDFGEGGPDCSTTSVEECPEGTVPDGEEETCVPDPSAPPIITLRGTNRG